MEAGAPGARVVAHAMVVSDSASIMLMFRVLSEGRNVHASAEAMRPWHVIRRNVLVSIGVFVGMLLFIFD